MRPPQSQLHLNHQPLQSNTKWQSQVIKMSSKKILRQFKSAGENVNIILL